MPRNGLLTRARRADRRADDPAWMRRFLERAPVGAVAYLAHGQPLINTNLFVFDEGAHAIYLHTARRGTAREGAEGPSPASFQAFTIGRLLPAERALDFSVEYASVAAIGTLEVVEDEGEALRALGLIMAKYAPHLAAGADYEAATPEDLLRTSVLRLRITSMSGKRNAKPERADAYTFESVTDGAGAPATELSSVSHDAVTEP